MSETLFILTIPFFLQRFGIKVVMLISDLRLGLPLRPLCATAIRARACGCWCCPMIVYGMAFDFFNISGSMFVNLEANSTIRASAQGLFMIMTNGLGAFLGTHGRGRGRRPLHGGRRAATGTASGCAFAGYALALGIVFPFVFRYKHDPAKMTAAAIAH